MNRTLANPFCGMDCFTRTFFLSEFGEVTARLFVPQADGKNRISPINDELVLTTHSGKKIVLTTDGLAKTL